MKDLSFGYMTAPTAPAAQEIVMALLEEELIACANILPGADSYFVWEGELEKQKEVLVFFKARAENEKAIVKRVRRLHPYKCPCVVFMPLTGGNPDFLEWVAG